MHASTVAGHRGVLFVVQPAESLDHLVSRVARPANPGRARRDHVPPADLIVLDGLQSAECAVAGTGAQLALLVGWLHFGVCRVRHLRQVLEPAGKKPMGGWVAALLVGSFRRGSPNRPHAAWRDLLN